MLSVHELAFATRSHVHWKRLVDGRSGAGQTESNMGTTEEVASLVLFLLSDESGYVTGAEVAIDGGASL